MKKWQLLSSKIPKDQDELVKLVLANRGIEQVKQFLTPIHPAEIELGTVGIDKTQLNKALKRLKTATKQQQKVLIFGDYDADGITAAAIVWLTLQKQGLTATPFIPNRQEHGYGLSVTTLQQIFKDDKPDLIITVDNGIVAHDALEYAQSEGVDVILTDHHQPLEVTPPATAIIHSTQICGAAVAWLLMHELDSETAEELLDLAGIATITDQMELLGPNRSFAYHGLQALRQTQRAGLKALYQIARIESAKISSYTIGFGLGPRLNAAGRLDDGMEALRLLCTNQVNGAKIIARKLDQINSKRQELTDQQLQLALQQAQKDQPLIFVQSDEFHEGIIGLIAGKLTEKYYRPSIVVSTDDQTAKASARSVPGIHITNLIHQADEWLIDGGGHELAAGFSAKTQDLGKIQQKLTAAAAETIDPENLIASLKLELAIPPNLVTQSTARLMQSLAPFGMGHRAPAFAFNDLEVIDAFTVGKQKKHLKLTMKPSDGNAVVWKAIGWNLGFLLDRLSPGQKFDLAGSLELNHWQGKTSLQIKIRDIHLKDES